MRSVRDTVLQINVTYTVLWYMCRKGVFHWFYTIKFDLLVTRKTQGVYGSGGSFLQCSWLRLEHLFSQNIAVKCFSYVLIGSLTFVCLEDKTWLQGVVSISSKWIGKIQISLVKLNTEQGKRNNIISTKTQHVSLITTVSCRQQEFIWNRLYARQKGGCLVWYKSR